MPDSHSPIPALLAAAMSTAGMPALLAEITRSLTATAWAPSTIADTAPPAGALSVAAAHALTTTGTRP